MFEDPDEDLDGSYVATGGSDGEIARTPKDMQSQVLTFVF